MDIHSQHSALHIMEWTEEEDDPICFYGWTAHTNVLIELRGEPQLKIYYFTMEFNKRDETVIESLLPSSLEFSNWITFIFTYFTR